MEEIFRCIVPHLGTFNVFRSFFVFYLILIEILYEIPLTRQQFFCLMHHANTLFIAISLQSPARSVFSLVFLLECIHSAAAAQFPSTVFLI